MISRVYPPFRHGVSACVCTKFCLDFDTSHGIIQLNVFSGFIDNDYVPIFYKTKKNDFNVRYSPRYT